MYADYAFYRSVFFGRRIPEADFSYFASRAGEYLDSVTNNRINADIQAFERVKMAVCAVADLLYGEEVEHGGVASETVAGETVNYLSGVMNTPNVQARLAVLAKRYLGATGLLYAGVWL